MEQDRMLFSNNRKVSIRQMKRLLFLEIFGVSSLLLPGILARICQTDGIFAIGLGAGLAAVLVRVLCALRLPHVTVSETPGQLYENVRPAGRILAVLYLLFFCLLGGFLLYLLTSMIENQLLDTGFLWIILLTLLAAGGYGVLRGIESRARIYEILFWFLMVPLLIMLVLAAKDVNVDYWLPVFACGWDRFFLGTAICFGFCLVSLLALCFLPHCAEPERVGPAAARAVVAAGILNIVLYLILLGVFQSKLLASLKYPVISLMAMAQIPGGLFQRQDALMVAIWFFCLFSLFHSALFYGLLQTKKISPQKLSKKSEGRGRISVVLVLTLAAALMCLLNGCSFKEPEQRMYPLALGIEKTEKGYQVRYACPDLGADGGGQGTKSPSGDLFASVEVSSLFEAEEYISQNTDKTLDFNHLKILLIDTRILRSNEEMEQMLTYFMDNKNLAWNTCVAAMDDSMEALFGDAVTPGKSLGTYLEDLLEGRPGIKKQAVVTVKHLISAYKNRNELFMIPQFEVKDQEPVIARYRIFDHMHDHGSIPAKDAWMGFLVQQAAGNVSMTLSDGTYVTIGDLKIERRMEEAEDGKHAGRTLPVQDLTVKGTLKISGSTILTAREKEQLRRQAQKELQLKLETFVNELSEKQYTDITDSYMKLAGLNRELWKSYRENPDAFEKKLYTRIQVELKSLRI